MKDEDVGGAIEGDDLAVELVAESGFDGENATHSEFLAAQAVRIHGVLSLSLISVYSTVFYSFRQQVRRSS